MYVTEYSIFLSCLGIAFWEALLADRIPYDDKPEYSISTDYAIDDIVIYCGIAYIAIKANKGSKPDTDCWIEAPKFNTACYNTFWGLHLKYYLALNVLWDNLHDFADQLISKALQPQQFQTTTAREYAAYQTGLAAQIETSLGIMKSFIKQNQSCFAISMLIGTACCGCCGYKVCISATTCIEGPQSTGLYEVA